MNEIAKALLETKAVHIKPDPKDYFTWTSGKKSPIYCDNRQLISYPTEREIIITKFTKLIKEKYSEAELIAGTATAGIPWAAWVADSLKLPMIYIRSKPKGHGLKSAIEGNINPGQKTLIIEDLISTGKSSLEACQFAMSDQLEVMAVLSIFTYGLESADNAFKEKHICKHSLCDFKELVGYARETNKLSDNEVESLMGWEF